MGVSEQFALAMTAGNLGWSDHAVRPVEYAAAMSGTSGLSSDMHRARDYDPAALKRAILQLASKAIRAGRKKRLPLSRGQAERLALVALAERIEYQCPTCHGAAVLIEADLKITCHACNGVGVLRYTDAHRAKMSGIKPEQWHKWESRYLLVLSIAQNYDRAIPDASNKLGLADK